MDRHERLQLLFQGEDKKLLESNTGLNTSHIPDSSSSKSATAGSHTQGNDQSDSEEGFDEYLSSFSQAAKKVSMRKDKLRADAKKNTYSDSLKKPSFQISNYRISLSESLESTHLCNSANDHEFCPLIAVSRFPYKYIRGGGADLIAKQFFDGGKFWNKTWDMYVAFHLEK